MEEKGVSSIIVIVIVIVIAAVGVGSYLLLRGGGEVITELPTRHIGDEWTYQVTELYNSYTFHHEVIAEETVDNKNCYVIEVIPTPPHEHGMGYLCYGGNEWMEKETGVMVKKQVTGEFVGTPFTKTQTFVYHSEVNMWPLQVGKEVTVTTTVIENDTISGFDNRTQTGTVKVEGREDITVPAGTFTCFKVVFYENGNVLKASWYSDSANHWVKTIYSETGTTHELISFNTVRNSKLK